MAEWKTQLSYNYAPPYHHAYAYGIMYQAGSEHHEQHHPGGLPSWADHGVAKLGSYGTAGGVHQPYYYAGAAPPGGPLEVKEEDDDDPSPPRSPEPSVLNKHGGLYNDDGPGMVYLGGGQQQQQPAGRLYLPDKHAASYDALGADDGGRTRSGTPTSDWEAHTSPDSWSSTSSKEECLPQADPASWIKKEFDGTETGSPDPSEDVPPILEVGKTFTVLESRGKLRTTFSEGQMSILVQRFGTQRYLSPAEMKNLAAQSGLTYQQVKTWFQNRRMKLRRHQKDAASPNPVAYSNMAPRLQQYQGDARTHLQEQYNHHLMEAGGVYKNMPPQNLAYYLAAMGATGTAGYHGSWSTAGAHAAPLPARSQGPGWPVGPPAVGVPAAAAQPYDYSIPNAYSSVAPSADSSDGRSDSPLYMSLVQTGNQ
ncbi:hypothetical protein NHX12_021328 [Muraenolepis orangiensis]|uniref:Homeobox domain-containing protein n=1 Tax=Muraenolepis orangiensis TaxID=630683 RepID=A0A9Q0EV81_9TELE|nr:hypothetical protein NHX12_021328 [Muraenolepis orangiensis]